MTATATFLPRRRTGALWLGRLCLWYENWLAGRQRCQYVEMSLATANRMAAELPSDMVVLDLVAAGDVRKFLRLFNTAYAGAPDYRRAGWIQAMALQASKGYDPSLIWIAFRGGEAVGFCMARQAGSKGRITGIGVSPRWRRHHIGSGLLNKAIDELRRRGVESISLSVAPGNTACLGLASKHGFADT